MHRKVFLKILLLGDSGVGKTSIINRYVSGNFQPKYKFTIGADYSNREISIDNRDVVCQIWDTAGQERFQALSSAFYRGADCCILVFDVTNRKSFENLDKWHNEFLYVSGSNTTPIVLLANKTDQVSMRLISAKYAQFWSQSKTNVCYFECSAKLGNGIDDTFRKISKRILDCVSDIDFMPEMRLGETSESKTSVCCVLF